MTNQPMLDAIQEIEGIQAMMKPTDGTRTEQQIREARGGNGWIDVRERLPEHRQLVIVWNAASPADGVTTGRRVDGNWCEAEPFDGFYCGVMVTHWQPLPGPPPADVEA